MRRGWIGHLLTVIATFGTTMSNGTCDQESGQVSLLQAILEQAAAEQPCTGPRVDSEAWQEQYTVEDLRQMTQYELLQVTGMLDEVLEYVRAHPEVIR